MVINIHAGFYVTPKDHPEWLSLTKVVKRVTYDDRIEAEAALESYKEVYDFAVIVEEQSDPERVHSLVNAINEMEAAIILNSRTPSPEHKAIVAEKLMNLMEVKARLLDETEPYL